MYVLDDASPYDKYSFYLRYTKLKCVKLEMFKAEMSTL